MLCSTYSRRYSVYMAANNDVQCKHIMLSLLFARIEWYPSESPEFGGKYSRSRESARSAFASMLCSC